MKLRALVIVIVAGLGIGRVSAQLNYDNWNFSIAGMNMFTTDSLASLGIRSDATPGFDNQYDIPRPPRSPSGSYIEVYFPHSGGLFPPLLGNKYAIDYQDPVNPVWNLDIEASDPGSLTLTWDSSYVNSIEPRVQLFLFDIVSGSYTNMRISGSYTFTYSVKRDFKIVGGINVSLKYLLEGFWNGVTQVRDTVRGYLAQPSSPYTLIDSAALYLSPAGSGNLVFEHAVSGNYYIVIRHRNHLEVWSSSPVALINGTTTATPYDFSSGAGTAYGTDALKQIGSIFAAWGGDVNQDGVVDFLDRNLTWNNRTLGGYLPTDCNGDMMTNPADDAIVLTNRLRLRQRP